MTEEITRSTLEPNIRLSQNPLSWWKINEHKFPKLAKLAKWMLCNSATSVPSERGFSTVGDILRAQHAQRACLKAIHVDMIIFHEKKHEIKKNTLKRIK